MRLGLAVLMMAGLSGCAMFSVDPAVPQTHATMVQEDAFGDISSFGFTIDDPGAQAGAAGGPAARVH